MQEIVNSINAWVWSPALVYLALGGKVGSAFELTSSQALPLLVAPFVYFFLKVLVFLHGFGVTLMMTLT